MCMCVFSKLEICHVAVCNNHTQCYFENFVYNYGIYSPLLGLQNGSTDIENVSSEAENIILIMYQ